MERGYIAAPLVFTTGAVVHRGRPRVYSEFLLYLPVYCRVHTQHTVGEFLLTFLNVGWRLYRSGRGYADSKETKSQVLCALIIISTRAIRENEEITVWYGGSYFSA